MAAVVASLAAFVTGFGLPALPTAGLGGGRVAGRDRDCSNSDGWHATDCSAAELPEATASAGYEKANLKERRPLRERKVVSALGSTHVAKPTAAAASTANGAVASAWPADFSLSALPPPQQAPRRLTRRAPRVHFDLDLNTVHEVTPYSEVYGLHPRDFNFARGPPVPESRLVDSFAIIPVCKRSGLCVASDDGDYEEDEQEDIEIGMMVKAGHFLFPWRARVPWPVWLVSCALLVVLRAVGADLCQELMAKGGA